MMLLVRDVSGPDQAVAGAVASYEATRFNTSDPSPEELRQINWEIKSGDDTVARFQNIGRRLDFTVPTEVVGKQIVVMPFRHSPTPIVSVTTRIVDEADVVSPDNRVLVLTRDDWGARTDLPRLGQIVAPQRRTEVFIHHTVVVDQDSTPNEWETIDEVAHQMRRLQTIREQDLGADVPYSMVAFCMSNGDLVLGEGRGLERSGAHTGSHNTTALGISFQGNFETTPLPVSFDVQLASLGGWLRQLREQHGFVNLGSQRPLGREVFAHRDVKATACPGEHLFQKLSLIRFL